MTGDTSITIQYWLDFKWTEKDCTFNCSLVNIGNHHYNCTLLADNKENTSFMSEDHFHVLLCNYFGCDNVTDFYPVKYVKPTPPSDLTVESTPDGYSFSWRSGYENHDYMTDFKYQLSIYRYIGNEERVKWYSMSNTQIFSVYLCSS